MSSQKRPDTLTDAELRSDPELIAAYSDLFQMFPDHPVEMVKGVIRWKKFPVNPLFHAYSDENAMKLAFIHGKISLEDWAKYSRDTGWSLSGYIDCVGRELGLWDFEEDEE